MRLYRSNRVEALVESLAGVVGGPTRDPLVGECIVVQGRGIERWLALELATRLGCFANAKFPFPRVFLDRVLASVVGDECGSGAAWEPEALSWAIAEALPRRLDERAFAPIRTYLRGDDDGGEKRIALASRIAETFDHYTVYRPEMVLAWQRGDDAAARRWAGPDAAWQAALWRDLVERLGDGHAAARVHALLGALDGAAEPGPGLPQRVCLFGLSTLPPLYVSALSALSAHVELHTFVLSPSREYWGWIRSERELLRRRRSAGAAADVPIEELQLDEGHPLLASLGRVGRELQEILEERTDYHESDADLYADPAASSPGEPCLLHTIQSDVLALRARGGVGDAASPVTLAADDHSIQIHACHGPMREAEVLRDQLLELFARNPDLAPHDVVVMAPDAALYAPYVEAAFAAGGDAGTAIPVRVADRGARSAYPVVEAFTRILDVLDGRLAAGDVLELLATDCVRARFGLGAEDEALLRAWIDASGIRWGVDADHRAREGQPRADENTWRFGLDRLFVGLAIEDRPGRLFADVAPQAGVEGAEAQALGRLAELTDVLFSLHARARAPLPVADWAKLFLDALDGLVADDGDRAHERRIVVEAIGALERAAEFASHVEPVPLSPVRDALCRSFEQAATTGGFVTGAVTMGEVLPMRIIPFRVVALLGLSDGAFPRRRPRPGFDLIGARRLPGDRSARDDDRQIFLEALLSARDHLLVSYVGRDIRDNEKKPPSVIVDELLDHVARIARPPEDDADATRDCEADAAAWVRDRLVVRHPLQPWSAEYFTNPDPAARLFSYSTAWCEAARVLSGPREPAAPFVAQPLAGATDEVDTVALDDLCAYFVDPAKHLVRDVLRLRLEEAEEVGPEREPLDVEGLEAYSIGRDLLEAALVGDDFASTMRRLVRQGRLPLGEAGRAAHAEFVAEVRNIARRVVEARGGDALSDEDVVVECGGARVVGRLDRLYPGGRVAHRFAKAGRPVELDVWIRHLALCAAAPAGVAPQSHLVGRPGDRNVGHVVFDAVEDASGRLAELVAIHRLGRTRPLPFLPRSSRKYADKLSRAPDDPAQQQKAIFDARAVYGESSPERSESQEVYLAQLFRDVDPLAPGHRPVGLEDDAGFGFSGLARRIFGPLLASREERR